MPQLDFGPFLNELNQLILTFFLTFFVFLKFFFPTFLLIFKSRDRLVLNLSYSKDAHLNLNLENLIKNKNLTLITNLNLTNLINTLFFNLILKNVLLNLNNQINFEFKNLNNINFLLNLEFNKILEKN